MLPHIWNRWFRKNSKSQPIAKDQSKKNNQKMGLENLEDRTVPATVDYQLGAFLTWTVPNQPVTTIFGYGYQRAPLTITLDAGETLTISSQLDTSNSFKGEAAPFGKAQLITDGAGNATNANILPAQTATSGVNLYSIGLTTTSSSGIKGTGMIGTNDTAPAFTGFAWSGLGTQNASGYLRSRGFLQSDGQTPWDGQSTQPFTDYGYLYVSDIIVQDPSGTGSVIFNGFTLTSSTTAISTASQLVGGGPWGPSGSDSFQVSTGVGITFTGPMSLGGGVFPSAGVSFNTGTFDNTFGGGQKIEFNSNFGTIASNIINIGTAGEKIYGSKNLTLSSRGQVMDIENPTGTSSYNLTVNELLAVQANGGLTLSSGNAVMNWGSTTGNPVNLLSANFGGSLTIANSGNVLFNNTVSFPNNLTFTIMPGASSDVLSNNPNDLDFIIQGGTLVLGPFNKTSAISKQLRNFGTSTKPISISVPTLGDTELQGSLNLYNKANPVVGGQSGDLNIIGPVLMIGDMNINVGNNTLTINTNTFRTTATATITSGVLNIAGTELRGDAGVNIRQFDPLKDFYLGKITATPNAFNLSLSDITTKISSGQTVTVGQAAMNGTFYVYSGDTTNNLLNLATRNFSLGFLGKTSSVLLNAGIKLADNRTATFDIGTGNLVGQTYVATNKDINIGGTTGAIKFPSAQVVGSSSDPLDVTVAQLGASKLSGDLNINVTQPSSTLEIVGQINAGLNAVRIKTLNANSNLLRTNSPGRDPNEADIVAGTIELLAGTGAANTIGTGASPVRIKGSSITAKVGGDIYLASMTADGNNGSSVQIANSGILIPAGGLTSGDAGRIGISGSPVPGASKSTFQLSANDLINRNSHNRGSLDIGSNTILDMGRFSETLGVLTGTGFITSDPVQGQAGKLTIDNGLNETCTYAGIISGDVQVVKTSSTVAAPQGAGTLNLGGANSYTGGTVVESGTLILSNNTAIGTGPITLGRSSGSASGVFMALSNNITVVNPIVIANQLVTIQNVTGSNTITSPITFGFATSIDVASPGGTPTTLNLAGALSGNQKITKLSAGNLVLSADNNMSGGLEVQAGYLEAQANNALGTGLTDFFAAANFGLKDPNPGDPTPLQVQIPGSIKFRGTSSMTAQTTATLLGNGGQILLTGSSATPLTINVANVNDTFSIQGSTSTNFIEDNNGNVNIVKGGGGTLKLSGKNNFNNLTTSFGTVIGSSGNAFGRGTVTVNSSVVNGTTVFGTVAFDPGLGNTIDLPNNFNILGPGDTQRTAALEGLSGTTNINGNITIGQIPGVSTVALSVSSGAVVDVNGSVSDGGNNLTIQKKGTGRLIFEQANNYGGGTQISAGEIQVKAQGALGNGTVITNQDTSLIFTLPTLATSTFSNPLLITGAGLDQTSGVIQVTSGTVKITTGEIKLLGNSTISVNPVNASLTLDGKITDQAIANGQPGGPNNGGPYSLTKKGTGKLTLNGGGLTTYRGGTSIQDGVVEVIAQNAMGTGLVNISDGAALLITGANIILPNNFVIAGKGGTGNPGVIQVTTGGTIATINGGIGLASDVGFGVVAGSKLIMTNQIDEASGLPGPFGIEKKGQGILRLEGTVPNLYDGNTGITEGEVQITKNSALGNGTVVISSGATLAPDSSINLANKISVIGDGYTGQGAIYARSGLSTFSGAVTLNGNTLLNGEIDTRIDLSGTITESAASKLTKNGLGTIRISGTSNSYTGPTDIKVGILEAGSNEALAKSDITIADKATLSTVGSVTLSNAKISAEGVGATVGLKTIGAIRSESGSSKLTGTITLNNATTVSAATGATLDLQGVIAESATNKTLLKGDLGTVILSGSAANTYTGGTNINQGTLVIRKAGALGDTTVNAPATIADKATLAIDAGAGPLTIGNPLRLQGVGADSQGALQTTSGTGILNSQAVITLDGDTTFGASKGATMKLGGTIADDLLPAARNIIKVGEGTVRLETTNSYEGTTTVNGGVLVAAASDAFGSKNQLVTVNNGTTLAIESSNPVSLTNPVLIGGAGTSAEGAAMRIGSAGTPTTAALTGTIGLSANTVIKVEDKSNGKISNTISKDGSAKSTVYLEKTGKGVLILTGNNTYDGGTKVTDGKLVADVSNTALSTQPISVASGATLSLAGNVALANVINLATGATIGTEANANASLVNPGNVNAAGDFMINDLTGSKLTLASYITDGAAVAKLTKTGPGELLVQNTTDNQIDGGVDVVGGLLTLNSAKATFAGNLLIDGSTNPATAQLLQSNEIADASKVTLTAGILNLNGNSDKVGGVKMAGISEIQGTGTLTSTTDFLFSQGQAFANLAGVVGLTKDTANQVLLSGNNTFSGDVNLQDGTLEIQGGQALNDTSSILFGSDTANLMVDNSETFGNLSSAFKNSSVNLAAATTITTGLATSSTYAGQLLDQGDGTLVKIGTGELTLTGTNKLSTLLDIAQGTLTIGSSDAMGIQNTGPLVIVEAGATLNFNLPGTSKFDNPIDLYGSVKGSKGTSNLTGAMTLFNNTNSVDVASGATVIIANAVPDATVLSVTLNKVGLGTLSFSGAITLSNPNAGALNVQAGTVIVSANNAVDGGNSPIVVSTGATLYADATGIVAGMKLDNPITLNGPGVSGAGALAAKGGLTILNSASNLTINTDSTLYVETGSTLQVDENLAGAGKLTISGGGKVILNGNSAGFTGDITVTNGELVVKNPNSLGTGTITVSASGKLTIDGSMTIANKFVLAGGLNGTAGSNVIFTGSITLTGTGNFSIGTGGSLDFQGTIKEQGGSFGVTSSGDGDVKLSAANSFTGTATVSGPGKMIIANTAAVSATNPVVVSAGTLELDVDTTLGSISGAGTIDLTSKTLTLGALNTSTNFSGDIVGAGNLVKVGTGTLTLSGTVANSFGGSTTVKAGSLILAKTAGTTSISGSFLEIQTGATVSLTNANQIDDATEVDVFGGTLNLNANNDSVGTVVLKQNGTISGTGKITTTAAPFDLQSGTITANIGGTLGITKSTVGTVSLGGNNTISGQVNVNAGLLILTTATALNANTPVFVDATGTLQLNFSNTIGSLDGTGIVDLKGNTLTTGAFGDSTFGGTLKGTASSKLVKAGTSTFDFAADGTTFLGPVDVTGGKLRVNATNSLNASNAVSVSTGATFEISVDETIGNLSGSGTAKLNSRTLTTGSLGDSAFSGDILGDSASKLIKTGGTTFTLSGTVANTFANAEVKAGSLVLNKTAGVNAIGSGTTTIQSGATLSLSASNQISDTGTVSVNGGTFATNGKNETVKVFQLISGNASGSGTVTSTQAFDLQAGTMNVILAGANGLTKSTAGTVTLNFANPGLAGTATISGGDLVITLTNGLNANTPVAFTGAGNLIGNAPLVLGALSSTSGNGNIKMGSNTLTVSSATDTSFSGIITGTSTLTKEGAGAQTLTGINTYAGPTTINNGKLILASTAVGTTIPGPITVNTSGTLQVNTATSLDSTILLNVFAGGLFDIRTDVTIGNLVGDGSAQFNANTLTTGSLGTAEFSGNIDGIAGSKLVKVGAFSYTLSGAVANTFASADVKTGTLVLNKTAGVDAIGAGTTAIQAGAVVSLSASNQISDQGTVSVNGGTFATNGKNETVKLFQLISGQVSGGGTVTSTQAFDLQAGIVNAILAGANGLSKSTAGVVTLNFANPALAGTATISGGDLIVTVTGGLNANTPVSFTGAGNLVANAPLTLGALASTGGFGTVQMGTNALIVSSATDTSFSGVISGSSTLTKVGTGAQTLTGINTYSGPTNINAGKLVLASTGVGTTIDGIITVNTGGTLETTTTSALDATNPVTVAAGGIFDVKANLIIGSLTGAGNTKLNTSSLTTGTLGSTDYSGKIEGSAGSKLVKVSSSTFTLSGTTANTFASADVQGGTLILNKTSGVDAIGSGTTTILTGALVSLSASNQISDGGTVSVNGGEFATNGNNETVNLLQLISGNVSGGGTVTSTTAFDLRAGIVNVILAGTNGLTKSTSGVVNLNLASPTLAGTVTITGGELILNALTAIGSGNAVNFTAAGTLTSNTALNIGALSSAGLVGSVQMASNDLVINAGTSGTFGGAITGTGKVTKQGTGTQTFTGANTYTGFTLVSAGTLALAGASNNAVIIGDVSIDGGTVRLDASEQIANDRTITMGLGGGTLALAGAGSATTETIKRLILVGGNVTGGVTSVLNVTELVDVAITNTAIDATITGSASFNLIGNVNYTVLKPFQVTGPINVFKGTMTLSSPISPSILTPLTITGPGKVVATLNDQVSDSQTVTINNDGILDVGSTNDTYGGLTLTKGTITGTTGVLKSATDFAVQSGVISAILGGTTGLVKTDSSGKVTLTRKNTFTGAVQVQGGTLELGANGNAVVSSSITVNGGVLQVGTGASGSQLPNSSTVTVSAGTYDLAAIDQTLAIINMTGGEITGGTGRLFTSQSNFNFANGRVSAILAGASTGLIATGTGTVVLANTNQYGGLTSITGGNLVADANANAIPGNVSITGGTLRLNRSSQISDSATLSMSGGTVDLATAQVSETIGTLVMDNGLIGPNTGNPRGTLNAATFDIRSGRINATLGGSGKLTKTTAGTLTLSATNTFSGGSDIKAGTVNVSALQGGSLPGTTAITGATVNLQAANQVPGSVTINLGGNLNVASFANTSQALNINGGTLTGSSGIYSVTGASGVQISSGNIDAILGGANGLTKTGTNVATLNKPGQYNGSTNINGGVFQLTGTGGLPDGSVVTVASGAKLDLNGLTDQFNGLQGPGAVSLGNTGNNSLILGITNPTATNDFSGVIDGTGTFVKSGSGSQTLSGANTFNGAVQVQGGTLALAGNAASVLPDTSSVLVSLGATLAVNKTETIGALTGLGTANLGAGSELTSSYGSATDVQVGLLGTGTFRKTGAGNISLGSSSGNFGGIVALVSGGLKITGILGGTTQVLGGNLTGTGQANIVQVTAGIYSPGSSPGTFTAGTFTGNASSTYLQEINGTVPGSSYDQTIITQGVNVTGMNLTTTFGNSFKPVAGQSFTMVDNQSSSQVTGTFNGLPEGKIFTVGTNRLQITYKGGNGNDIVLSVPQASSTYGMVLGSPGNVSPGAQSIVTVYNTSGSVTKSFVPFAGYGGALRTAVGDVTGDGVPDIAVVTGVGGVPAVKVFNGSTNAVIYSFLAFDQGFAGGLSVAMGDTNGDGTSDIIIGTLTASSHTKVYSGANLTLLKSFFPFGSAYTGGINVAAGDVTGDGKAELIIGAASNSSRVVVDDVSAPGTGTFTQISSFFAFTNQMIPGGVFVSAADLNGDGKADILAGSGNGATPQMRVFTGPNATPGLTVNLSGTYLGGVRVTIGDLNGDGLLELIAGAGPGNQPLVSSYAATNGALVRQLLVYPSTFRGGVVF